MKLHEICNFLFESNKTLPPLRCIVLFISELLVIFIFSLSVDLSYGHFKLVEVRLWSDF